MSVNIKRNGALLKLGGLYQGVIAALASLIDTNISSPSNGQILKYNSTTSKWENAAQDIYLDQSVTLSTSTETTVTFTNVNIHTTSAISVWTTLFGLNATNMVTTEGQCVVTLPIYETAESITCRIYIK